MKKATITVIDTLNKAKNPFWKVVDDDSSITLLHFETYGKQNAPDKFRIEITDNDTTSVIEVDPKLDSLTHTYGLHHMGNVFDMSKVKIVIIALNESGSEDRLSFRMHYNLSSMKTPHHKNM